MGFYKVYYLSRGGGTTSCVVRAADEAAAREKVQRKMDDVIKVRPVRSVWSSETFWIIVTVVGVVAALSLLIRFLGK